MLHSKQKFHGFLICTVSVLFTLHTALFKGAMMFYKIMVFLMWITKQVITLKMKSDKS